MGLRRLTSVAGISLVLLAGFSGCGGGDEGDTAEPPTVSAVDRGKLEIAVNQLEIAGQSASGARFCSLVQPSLVDEAFKSKRDCAKQAKAFLTHGGFGDGLEIESIVATPKGATVKFDTDPASDLPFVKEGDAWFIDLRGVTGAQK